MTTKKILSISFAITIGHFFLTLTIGHYIGIQIGSRMGQVVASGILDTSNQHTEDANGVYQKMKDKSDDILEEYKVAHILLSLPIRFFLKIKSLQLQKVMTAIIF